MVTKKIPNCDLSFSFSEYRNVDRNCSIIANSLLIRLERQKGYFSFSFVNLAISDYLSNVILPIQEGWQCFGLSLI